MYTIFQNFRRFSWSEQKRINSSLLECARYRLTEINCWVFCWIFCYCDHSSYYSNSLRARYSSIICFLSVIRRCLDKILTSFSLQISLHGSVVSDNKVCSDAGVSMLRDKGSAVDAVIATAFCMGVFHEHITGLGR